MSNRAWRIHDFKGIDSLVLETLPMPEPGPGEVRVKVKAVGLNRSDLLWITAGFFTPELPALVGAEFCGVVDAVGEGVSRFKPGDRVSNTFAPLSYANFGEYTVCQESSLVPTPECLSDMEGAAFFFTHITQMLGLVERAQIRPGQTVLITAGTSANGNSAILIAKLIGARVIATSRSSRQRDTMLALGADHVIATGGEVLSERVAEITGGKGADIVYDCVGGAITEELLKSCAPGATWIMLGFLDPSPVTVNWPLWFTRQPMLQLFSATQYSGAAEMGFPGRPEQYYRAVQGLLALIDSGRLAIPIGATMDGIDKVPDAFRMMEANQGGGKIVVSF